MKKRKPNSKNPAAEKHIDEHPVARAAHRRLEAGVLLVRDLQPHIAPMGDCLITLEQWRYIRGSVVADLAIYAQITGRPSPIEQIIASEQERVLVDF